MKVALAFVPPGGGETDYSLEVEMPAPPQPGDYIFVSRGKTLGTHSFIVKRTHWVLQVNDLGDRGKVAAVCVECEFADSVCAAEDHKQTVDLYEKRTGKRIVLDTTVY